MSWIWGWSESTDGEGTARSEPCGGRETDMFKALEHWEREGEWCEVMIIANTRGCLLSARGYLRAYVNFCSFSQQLEEVNAVISHMRKWGHREIKSCTLGHRLPISLNLQVAWLRSSEQGEEISLQSGNRSRCMFLRRGLGWPGLYPEEPTLAC